MKICVVGVGYVGLVCGTCLAESGNDVLCVDADPKRVEELKKGIIPIYEPGLGELVERNSREGRLSFTTHLDEGVKKSSIIFICVGTPQGENGHADLSAFFDVVRGITANLNAAKIIVDKSTVPVGTARVVQDMIAQATDVPCKVVSNPEFLKEGNAVDDFMKPDRIIIGTDDVEAARVMSELYEPFVRTGHPILVMSACSAEMSKYASNVMLAARISLMNEIANLCEQVGADIDEVRLGVGADTRIGYSFLFPGAGYGGSCFPKDVQALVAKGSEMGYPMRILEAVEAVNNDQKQLLAQKVISVFGGDLTGKTFALWGLAFKPRTDDMREAPSLVIVDKLLASGAALRAYDPVALDKAKELLGNSVHFAKNPYDALEGVDALLIVTEWPEFRRPDFDQMKQLMKSPVIFDGRNIYDPEKITGDGFCYYCIGRAHYTC